MENKDNNEIDYSKYVCKICNVYLLDSDIKNKKCPFGHNIEENKNG